jgi:uncharacterized membrane protein
MRTSKHSSSKPNAISPRVIALLFLVFSLVGFLDATYLTIEHYRGAEVICGPLWDCQAVANSRYADIGGVPIALGGAIFYLAILLLSIAYFDTKRGRVLTIAAFISIPGFLASLILIYLQVFVLHALCFYCLLSALVSTALFGNSMLYLKLSDRQR